jgi:acyl-CoA synthetase (AMP-forming)/AMP-acid ligase II
MQRFASLHELLAAQAREDRHVTFIDGEDEQRVLSFAQLRQRATAVLGALQRSGLRAGHAMLLSLADNERFLEMFWACVLGGIVPVPLAPASTDETRRKLLRVFAQFERASVCIDGPALERLEGFAAEHGAPGERQRLQACALLPGRLDVAGAPGEPVTPEPDSLAFIQYSSGSTGEPKGVLLTHRNLTANITSIIAAAEFSDRDVALSWMPLSHDMGLIGFHLNMLACGASHALMRTELFARRPLAWLEQASRRRATVLCSPNFGYQHYLRQYASKPPARLDLSAVRLVFNGAEPISAELSRRFLRTMAPHGLRRDTMFAVYGLAEASLAVSFPRPGSALKAVRLQRDGLRVGAPARPAPPDGGSASEFVKVGRPVPGTEVDIADATGAALGEGMLGHVRIRGDNVTPGYHRGATRGAQDWLDTGDLGLFLDGELVITGRAKDLVIVNGQNYYPHDLERIAEEVEGIESNRAVAAGVRPPGAETEELALFVLHRGPLVDFVPTVLELRRTLLRQTGLEATHVVPVRHIPKTSSGKLQRHVLAQAFEQGEFAGCLAELARLLSAGKEDGDGPPQQASTVTRLHEICAGLVGDRRLTPQTNLLEINLNSLTLAQIHEAIEREYPQRVEVTDLIDYPTLEQLAAFLDANAPRALAADTR